MHPNGFNYILPLARLKSFAHSVWIQHHLIRMMWCYNPYQPLLWIALGLFSQSCNILWLFNKWCFLLSLGNHKGQLWRPVHLYQTDWKGKLNHLFKKSIERKYLLHSSLTSLRYISTPIYHAYKVVTFMHCALNDPVRSFTAWSFVSSEIKQSLFCFNCLH